MGLMQFMIHVTVRGSKRWMHPPIRLIMRLIDATAYAIVTTAYAIDA